jgi:hypothetical protein
LNIFFVSVGRSICLLLFALYVMLGYIYKEFFISALGLVYNYLKAAVLSWKEFSIRLALVKRLVVALEGASV